MARTLNSLDPILTRRRWTPDDARTVLAAAAASGLGLAAFAARHNVQAQRLFAWRRRLAGAAAPGPLTFVEVGTAPVAPPTPPRYEIVLTTGETLRLEGTIEAATVRTLLAVLRAEHVC